MGSATGLAARLGHFIHTTIPHEKGSIYLWTGAFCICAILYVYLRCRLRSAHACLEKNWWLTTIVHAAPMAVYLLMPLAPLDPDLMTRLAEDQIVIALAGIYAFSVSFGEVRQVAREACELRLTKPADGNLATRYAAVEVAIVFFVFCSLLAIGSAVWNFFY